MFSRNFWASPALVFPPIAVTVSFPPAAPWSMCTYMSVLYLLCVPNYISDAQPCPNLCPLMDCNLPGSSVHGILQARILEWNWVAISSSRESFQPRDQTCVSCICGQIITLVIHLYNLITEIQFTDKSNAFLDLQHQSVSAIQKSI